MQEYAEKKGLMSQGRRMLTSSSELTNGKIITPLLLFYLELRLECTENYCFIEYTLLKCFDDFVQSAVDARQQRHENPNSRVVAEPLMYLANSSYGYQFVEGSRHSMTNYTNNGKTDAAIYSKVFKRMRIINDQLYKVEVAKSEIGQKEPINVGFFILQYAKLRMLEPY